jgi:hypothetical protein
MLGNLGAAEITILAGAVAIPATLVAGAIVVAASLRRRPGTGMAAPDPAQTNQILEALQKMDQRIANLEAILMQRGNASEAERER